MGFVPLTITPPIVEPETEVYEIISSPIKIYPRLVVPTPTPSKVLRFEILSTEIAEVEFELYERLNFVGAMSDSTPDMSTKFSLKYIPWFLWLILICNPSLSTIICVAATFPPEDWFRFVVIPALFTYLMVFAAPTAKSPWTLSKINSLIPVIIPTDNLALDPTEEVPIVVIPKTSPTLYPIPPFTIVAAIATPLLTVIFAVAFLPFPVIVVSEVLLNVYDPEDGVYPIPELLILKLPVAIPALST